MDDSTISALNQSAAAMANSAAVINGANATKRQRKWMEKMYEQQREYQLADRADARAYALDLWNMQNAYNAPSAEIARMKEAGISPNNAAASIAGVQASASAPQPLYNPVPSVPAPYSDNTADSLAKAALNYSQLANLNAQTSKLKADTAKVEAETEKTFVDIDVAKQQLKSFVFDYEHLQPMRAKELATIIDKTLSDKKVNDAEVSQIEALTKRTVKEADRIDYEIERLESEVKLNRERLSSEITGQERDRASAALSKASEALERAKKEQTDLFNTYEKELQSFGTSTSAASNPIVNAKDQAAVVAGRGLRHLPDGSYNKDRFSVGGRSLVNPSRSDRKYKIKGYAAKYAKDED